MRGCLAVREEFQYGNELIEGIAGNAGYIPQNFGDFINGFRSIHESCPMVLESFTDDCLVDLVAEEAHPQPQSLHDHPIRPETYNFASSCFGDSNT